jgi:hypothetical protein
MPEDERAEGENPEGENPESEKSEDERPESEVVDTTTAETAKPSGGHATREQLFADLKGLVHQAKISPENYAEVGSQLFKLNLILEYLKLLENARAAESEPQPVGAAIAEDRRTATRISLKTRLEARKTDLIEKLRLYCWEALQAARLLLDELKCNTFPEDLQKELKDHPQRVDIKTNPPVPVLNGPTELSVWFHRQDYEHAAARDELFCWWTFKPIPKETKLIPNETEFIPKETKPRPNETKSHAAETKPRPEEKGWNVWHVFDSDGLHSVEVTFRDAAGCPVVCNGHKVKVKKTFRIAKTRTKWYLRGTIELLQFLVSLVVVVVALMAGAMEKIDQLDTLHAIGALIGIGFAANTVKNLITPSNSKN